jgi:hypothetical protein
MRKFMNKFNNSIFDLPNSVPIKEEISALTGDMVAPEEQSCWLVCKLTSQAMFKDISIRNLNLQLNPEIADFVQISDSVGCEKVAPNAQGDNGAGTEDLCIEPGESYEVLFKLYVDKIKTQARSFMEDVEELGLAHS